MELVETIHGVSPTAAVVSRSPLPCKANFLGSQSVCVGHKGKSNQTNRPVSSFFILDQSAWNVSIFWKVQPLFSPKAFNLQTKAPAKTGSALSPRRPSVRENVAIPGDSPGASWYFSSIPIFPPVRPSPTPAPLLSTPIQRKLKVGAADDPLEHEADHIADQVMCAPAPDTATGSALPNIGRHCDGCEKNKLQKEESGLQTAASDVPAKVAGMLHSSNQPLDSASRAFFEPHWLMRQLKTIY